MKRFNFMRFREAISRELMNMANDCGTADEFRSLLSTNGICLRDFFEEETAEPNNTLIDPDIEEDLFCPPIPARHCRFRLNKISTQMRGGRYQHRPYHKWYGRCFIYFKLYQSKILLKNFWIFLKMAVFAKKLQRSVCYTKDTENKTTFKSNDIRFKITGKEGSSLFTAFVMIGGSLILAEFGYMAYVYFCGNPFM